MQLTHFDRWLREKFVYQTHIHTLRPPTSLPAGIRTVKQPELPGQRYKYHYVAKTTKAANALIRQLRDNSQMYSTQIVDRDAWFVPLIAPKNKSLSWWIISMVFLAISVFYVLLYLKGLAEDPVFRQNFLDTIRIMKG